MSAPFRSTFIKVLSVSHTKSSTNGQFWVGVNKSNDRLPGRARKDMFRQLYNVSSMMTKTWQHDLTMAFQEVQGKACSVSFPTESFQSNISILMMMMMVKIIRTIMMMMVMTKIMIRIMTMMVIPLMMIPFSSHGYLGCLATLELTGSAISPLEAIYHFIKIVSFYSHLIISKYQFLPQWSYHLMFPTPGCPCPKQRGAAWLRRCQV